MSKLIFSVIFIILYNLSHAADIRLFDYKGGGWVELSGRIVAGDTQKIALELKKNHGKQPLFTSTHPAEMHLKELGLAFSQKPWASQP